MAKKANERSKRQAEEDKRRANREASAKATSPERRARQSEASPACLDQEIKGSRSRPQRWINTLSKNQMDPPVDEENGPGREAKRPSAGAKKTCRKDLPSDDSCTSSQESISNSRQDFQSSWKRNFRTGTSQSPASSISMSQSQSPLGSRNLNLTSLETGMEDLKSPPSTNKTISAESMQAKDSAVFPSTDDKKKDVPSIRFPAHWRLGRKKKSDDESSVEFTDSDSEPEEPVSKSVSTPVSKSLSKPVSKQASKPLFARKRVQLPSDSEPESDSESDSEDKKNATNTLDERQSNQEPEYRAAEEEFTSNLSDAVKATDKRRDDDDDDLWMDNPKRQPEKRRPAKNPLVLQEQEIQRNLALQQHNLSRSRQKKEDDALWASDEEERRARLPTQSRQRQNRRARRDQDDNTRGATRAVAQADRTQRPVAASPNREQGINPDTVMSRSDDTENRPAPTESPSGMNLDEVVEVQHPEFESPTFGPFENEPLALRNCETGSSDHKVPAALARYLPQFQRDGIKFMYNAIANGRGVILGALLTHLDYSACATDN